MRIQHGYDRGGDRLYRRDMVATTAGQALNELYAYDQMNQLTSMERGVLNTDGNAISNKTFGEQFTFDTTGNWLNYKRDANGDGTFEVDQTRTHNLANEILTISGGSTLVSHDRNGCMTKVPKPNSWSSAYTLVYDAWNRLTSVSDGDTLVATYMYDARNHRIKTTVGTTVTLKYFNRNWQEIESVTNNVTTGYVYGLRYVDDIICRTSGSETLYALQDPNWNVVALVNTSSTVAERLTYDSFGRVTFRNASFVAKTASSYNWTKTFTGQVYDFETGLMLYRNRYYHPGLGRFITRDPIGYNANDVNLYRYVESNPLVVSDPFGLEKPNNRMLLYLNVTVDLETSLKYELDVSYYATCDDGRAVILLGEVSGNLLNNVDHVGIGLGPIGYSSDIEWSIREKGTSSESCPPGYSGEIGKRLYQVDVYKRCAVLFTLVFSGSVWENKQIIGARLVSLSIDCCTKCEQSKEGR